MAIPAAPFVVKRAFFNALKAKANQDGYVIGTISGVGASCGIGHINARDWVKQFSRMGVLTCYKDGSTTLIKITGDFTVDVYENYQSQDKRRRGVISKEGA